MWRRRDVTRIIGDLVIGGTMPEASTSANVERARYLEVLEAALLADEPDTIIPPEQLTALLHLLVVEENAPERQLAEWLRDAL